MVADCHNRNVTVSGVIAPASTVAATAIVAVGIVAPVANAFSAATAVLLALDNAYADPVVGDVAAGFVAALPGVIAIAVLAEDGLGDVGAGASMALAAAAVYLSVERSVFGVIAVISAVPLAVLAVRRYEHEDAVASFLLAAVAAAAARGAVKRNDGVCDNDTDLFERRDYAVGLAYILGTAALLTLVRPQPTQFGIALLASSALVLTWSVTNAHTHWMTVSIVVAGTLFLGSLFGVRVPARAPPPKPRPPPPPKSIYIPEPTPVNWM